MQQVLHNWSHWKLDPSFPGVLFWPRVLLIRPSSIQDTLRETPNTGSLKWKDRPSGEPTFSPHLRNIYPTQSTMETRLLFRNSHCIECWEGPAVMWREGECNQSNNVVSAATWLFMQGTFTVTASGGMDGGPPFSKGVSKVPPRRLHHLRCYQCPWENLGLRLLKHSQKTCTSSGTNTGSGETTSLLQHIQYTVSGQWIQSVSPLK